MAIELPNVTLASTTGDICLTDYQEKPLVLYFYPKDNTPGCTQESKDFRDRYADFKAKNCTIFGVSRDSLASHSKFREKHQLPFDLIADTESQLCEHFDVLKPKKLFGKAYVGIERSTFLFLPKIGLASVWKKVKVNGHVNAVLDKLN